MEKIHCSVGILTFNSAAVLRRVLESLREFDDVVICDGGSTDGTISIAKEFGARVIMQEERYKNADGTLRDYSGVRNQLLNAAKDEWFLYIDSDETISDGLREDIRKISKHTPKVEEPLAYRIPIGILMDGRYIKYSSNYPGYQFRFFNRRSGARFIKPVHERISFDPATPTGTLSHPWYIHTTREYWRHYIRETGGYRPVEVALYCNRPLGDYLINVMWYGVRASAGVIGKALKNYVLHGFQNSVPVSGELGRAVAPLILVVEISWCKVRRVFQ